MGFHLTRLTLKGTGVDIAEVRFRRGLNVISGPSDTGKTFIFQCIDYMFGASDQPKEIPVLSRYDSLELGLSNGDDQGEMILKRSLRGGNLRLSIRGHRDRTLKAKHQAGNDETVSSFLLGLSGLFGKIVLKSKTTGKTRPLSFRDLARLVLVDEETIISETSPVLSGQFTTKTVEIAVFRLLLSGVDDSTIIAVEDSQEVKTRLSGSTEVLEVLLERAQAAIDDLNLDVDSSGVLKQLSDIELLFERATAELAVEQEGVAILEGERRDVWTNVQQAQSRINVLSELQRRFELLGQQYSSDLRRLDSIAEAGARLGQMNQERCPVCGALAEHQVHEHQTSDTAPIEVANACRAEANKIRILLVDLETTRSDNAAEIKRLSEELRVNRVRLDSFSTELRDRLEPRLQITLQRLKDGQERRDVLRHALELHSRAAELGDLLAEFNQSESPKKAEGVSKGIGSAQIEEFSLEVQALLEAWHFPNLDRVTFSEEDNDIVISGQRRASHGKGVRAIAHAAFNLALLRYCENRAMPHPGLVIIDSPLVVYEEPDMGEDGFAPDLKDAFYRSIEEKFREDQVIVFENEKAAPPPDLNALANIIKFTGTNEGRWGFIPG